MKKEEGAYKKKGAAESVEQEKKDLGKMAGDVKQMDTPPARKKGAAQGSMATEKTAKQLKAEGKKLKKDARAKKKAEKKASRATKKSDRKTKKSKKLQDKIDLQTLKGEQKANAGKQLSARAKQSRVKKLEAKKAKADKGTDREVKAGVAKKKGAANYEDGYPPAGSGKKKGASKKKGSADYSVDKGSHDHPHGGPGRMGFTQNFGPARQNSYARGAAKVAKIMGYPGAGDAQGGKAHKHSEFDINAPLPAGSDDSGTGGFTGKPKTNRALKKYQTNDIAAGRGPSTPNANVAGGSIPGSYPKMDVVRSFSSTAPLSRGFKADAPKSTASNPRNEKLRNSMIDELTTFMGVPTNSQRLVNEKISTMKSGTDGSLVSDIIGPGKGKNHGKKKH